MLITFVITIICSLSFISAEPSPTCIKESVKGEALNLTLKHSTQENKTFFLFFTSPSLFYSLNDLSEQLNSNKPLAIFSFVFCLDGKQNNDFFQIYEIYNGKVIFESSSEPLKPNIKDEIGKRTAAVKRLNVATEAKKSVESLFPADDTKDVTTLSDSKFFSCFLNS